MANRGLYTFLEGTMQLEKTVAVLLGDGPLFNPLERWVAQQEWQGRVYLPGRIPLAHLLDYTAGADVGVALIQNVCLSYYYSLPNKLFEYMQAGLPMITSNFPEMQRIVEQEQIGVVVDPESSHEFSDALKRLLENRELYAKMQVNALKAAGRYNWQHESQKLLDIYQQFKEQ